MANQHVYIPEFIDVIGHNRARYMQHMTANWCPVAREERNQLCFGVWATVGATGRWPEVVNLWEISDWEGLAADFEHELVGAGAQDPSLVEWWAAAASLRRGGVDRIVVPEPWSPSIDEHNAAGTRGAVYAHEVVTTPLPALIRPFIIPLHADFERTFYRDFDESRDQVSGKVSIDPLRCSRIEYDRHAMGHQFRPHQRQGAIEECPLRLRVGRIGGQYPSDLIGLQHLYSQT